MDKKMEEINSILDKIEAKQKEIESIDHEIKHVLAQELNDLCRDVIFSKFKKGQFITHRDKYVFELGEPWTIHNCHVNVNSYANIKYKFFSASSDYQPLCRAISFLDNARPSTKEEIEDYRISKRNAQYRHKILGI